MAELALELAAARNFDERKTARLLAVLQMAEMDASIACWEAKYHYRTIRQPPSLTSLEAAVEAPAGGPPVVDIAIADASVERLQQLLQQLPADQRRVLELRAAGLKGAEIAAVLERSPVAVRMLQLRAVRHLRTLLHTDHLQGIAP